MSTLKTVKNNASVAEFLYRVDDLQKRRDSFAVLEIMKKITGLEPCMWGDSIVGFGEYHYKSKAGSEGDWFLTGFSPRKQNLALYIMAGFERFEGLMANLGKYKHSVGCLYVKKLDDINLAVLEELISGSVEYIRRRHS